MVLRDLYKKDINRFIEGVIKADDDSNVLQEVEEYIITDELDDKLETFFDVYTSSAAHRASNTGVWISGFFGSGKSHLLKILSYVLENRNIDGHSTGEIFLDKINRDSFELHGHVKKALTIPARTILFNIDQKSDITSKSQPDAVLSVFVKVFNELQGYYPKYGYIAAFERDLDKQGLYEDFKKAYQEIAGAPWEQGREIVFFEIDNFNQALSRVKGISKEDAARVMEQYEKQYSVSIEEFARHVKEYIDKQDKDFRLIFCVDEMGQYISENTKLMLNLQTIAESLATICQGQAWLLVTSQEDLENIIGDLNKRQANDFSRIQARFKTRLNLTSANVDEVIHKRLLEKNIRGIAALTPLYDKEQNNFKTLFRFSDDSRQYTNFKDRNHFLFTYPFVPYQFDLFQSAIRGLSRHNAFQGRHQSVGERSMLGVFQVVAQRLAEKNPGVSVSFDLLFDGIRATLRSEIQNAVIQAEKNLSKSLDIKLLKTLFLVKYVDEFVANVENLVSLMVDSFDTDRLQLAQDIQTSLNRLQQQTYIQHTVGAYEFLTNEEKDIENEIKDQEVDAWEINDTLAKFIFDDIIRDAKIRFEENKQDYPFSKKMDEALKGRVYELGVHVFTPRFDGELRVDYLKSLSMQKNDLILQLQDDRQFDHELVFFKKTEKYCNQKLTASTAPTKKQIIEQRARQNTERRSALLDRLEELMVDGTVYLNGAPIGVTASTAKTKIQTAFQQLIHVVYPYLRMLTRIFREEDIKHILLQGGDDLFNDADLSEAELEIVNFVQRRGSAHERVTIHTLLERFFHQPYGWYQSAVLCLTARLFIRNKIELLQSSNELDKPAVLRALTNNREFSTTIINASTPPPAPVVAKVKKFCFDFFNGNIHAEDYRSVYQEFKRYIEQELTNLRAIYAQRDRYPFVKPIETTINDLSLLLEKPADYIYDNVDTFSSGLLAQKREFLDAIKSFMNNSSQKQIYDEALSFLDRQNANLSYLDSSDKLLLTRVKDDAEPYKGDTLRFAKTALTKVQNNIETLLEVERHHALKQIQVIINRFSNIKGFDSLEDSKKQSLLAPLNHLMNDIKSSQHIAVIRDKSRQAEDQEQYSRQEIYAILNSGKKEKFEKMPLALSELKPAFSKTELRTKEDVQHYVNSLRDALLDAIHQNKIIKL